MIALHLAARDPRVPWPAKAVAACVAAYALSPIDLIPDFVPVLGYLDDLVVVPLGILLAVKLVPPDLMAEFREEARRRCENPTGRAGAAIVVSGVWSPPCGSTDEVEDVQASDGHLAGWLTTARMKGKRSPGFVGAP